MLSLGAEHVALEPSPAVLLRLDVNNAARAKDFVIP